MGGSLEYSEIQPILKKSMYKNIKNFVESGTYLAESTIMASKCFENVYTIEIEEDLYNKSKQKAADKDITNIKFYLGDSTKLLKEIVPKVVDGACFFIDAHLSGEDSNWNGKQRVPLYQELQIILSHKMKPSIFIFDDVRLFNNFHDWSGITQEGIINVFKSFDYKIKTAYISNDRMYILTK
jgi:hypothetical protein